MALIDKLTAIADAVRGKTGGTGLLTLDDMAAAIAGIPSGGGGSGVTVTEYVVTEDADRSLWLNEQGIKLVKGINLILSGVWFYGGKITNNRTGLIVSMVMLWDGTVIKNSNASTISSSSHLRGYHGCSNGWGGIYVSSTPELTSGNTSTFSVNEDGLLSFTTSATGVTTGNYNNSFFGAGNTYYLVQVPSEEVC